VLPVRRRRRRRIAGSIEKERSSDGRTHPERTYSLSPLDSTLRCKTRMQCGKESARGSSKARKRCVRNYRKHIKELRRRGKRLLLVLESLKSSLDHTPTFSAYRCLSVAVVSSTF
jgi:hypothetical protein